MTSVPFTSLPQTVQNAIVGQVPAGAQLGQIIQETTPQGTTTYRAQVMQNGVVSELSLNGTGLNGTALGATAGQSINPTTGTVNPLTGQATALNGTAAGALNGTASTLNGIPATSGVVLGTPYAFETLPAPVQSAFASQAGGTTVTNVTYVAGANGNGMYRGFANGRPVAVRVGANGQIVPSGSQIASTTRTATTTATNEVTIDAVPMAVRDSIKKSMPFGEITRIRTGDTASGKLYDVTLRNGTDSTTMQVAEDGTIVRQDTEGATVSTASTTTAVTNETPKVTLANLPVAVRDTVDVRAPSKSIRSLVLTNFQGKTSYAVDYLDKDAMRHRLFIGKDGVVVNVQTNIYHITAPSQTVVVADLPAATRTAIQAQIPNSSITRVDEAMRGSNQVYVVTYIKDGEQQQLLVSRDGTRLDENEVAARAAAIDATNAAVGAAATVETGKENK